eukprot:CAMPEP_0169427014 /NCGR_PEP_ID=MMETSP1042-20121227/537_1 /TAXON_ID=464988 /ORGANISM="Hemiselmis andersenii, Strain CCMP1180" /LENGTH=81 /DNA_ID=CAMNT_0009537029 /DNA_START=86 /DNA_END=331 /DNA_ORIENTATION=+
MDQSDAHGTDQAAHRIDAPLLTALRLLHDGLAAVDPLFLINLEPGEIHRFDVHHFDAHNVHADAASAASTSRAPSDSAPAA